MLIWNALSPPGRAWGGGIVVVGTADGRVIGIRADSGEVLWISGVTSEVLAVPGVSPNIIVAKTGDGRVFGLDPRTGERFWIFERTLPVLTLRGSSSPVLMRDAAYIGLDNGRLVALDPQKGTLLWEVPVAVPSGRSELERLVDIDADPVIYRNDLAVVAYQGRLAVVDAITGRTRWEREFSALSPPAINASTLFATDATDRIWALDRFSGAAIWRQDKLRALKLTGPAIIGDYIVVGDSDGYLNFLGVNDGEIVERLRVSRDRIVAAPIINNGWLYVLSGDGTLTALR